MLRKLRNRFWLSIARFAFYRVTTVTRYEDLPDGIPFLRDPTNPCPIYEPRPIQPGDWPDCQTDGHYLCEECCHNIERNPENEPA